MLPTTDRPNLPKELLLVALYQKPENRNKFAAYVDCSISALTKSRPTKQATFKMRVDTGADITCIPKEFAKNFMPLLAGKNILIRLAAGGVKCVKLKMLVVTIHCDNEEKVTFRPTEGVLLVDSKIGLLGMDILSRLDVRFCNDTIYIGRQQGGAS